MLPRFNTCSIILFNVLPCSACNVAGMPPQCIWNILMFSPSLFSETSAVSFRSSFTSTTMTSADFLTHRNRIYFKTSPGKSFFLHPMPATSTIKRFCILWTLQSCDCLSSFNSLLCRFCSSVPNFAVWLPSLLPSPITSLPLANASGRYSRT